jgi:myo-inositol-1(or 4)-monophosphatase
MISAKLRNFFLELEAFLKRTDFSYKETFIKRKQKRDIVTLKDILLERKIINFIEKRFPYKCTIISEELRNKEYNKTEEYLWVIDPVDGTVNFANGIPIYSTSIALLKDLVPIYGLVYAPKLNRIYRAIRGEGAFCNNKVIKVSNKNKIEDSVVSVMLTSHYSIKRQK